jgi:hypothetical protein
MPIPKSIKETWTEEYEGVEYTLAPIRMAVQAKALDLHAAGKEFEAALLVLEQGGLRGWKSPEEEVKRVGPAELERLTPREMRVLGSAVLARCILTEAESD